MRPGFRSAALAALLLSAATPSLAQAPSPAPAAAAGSWYQTLYAPDLIGKPVRNASGADLAKIEEIATAPGGSLVAVLQSGGFLGFGGKHAVVPLSELQKGDATFVLPQGSKEKLAARPDFDKAKYPPVSHFVQLGAAVK